MTDKLKFSNERDQDLKLSIVLNLLATHPHYTIAKLVEAASWLSQFVVLDDIADIQLVTIVVDDAGDAGDAE
jgi:hypothetical protein